MKISLKSVTTNKRARHLGEEDLATQKAPTSGPSPPPPLVGAKEWSQNKQNTYLNIKYKLQNMHLGSNLCAIPNRKLSSWPTRGS
jgi:hypothetical protein